MCLLLGFFYLKLNYLENDNHEFPEQTDRVAHGVLVVRLCWKRMERDLCVVRKTVRRPMWEQVKDEQVFV